MPSARTAFGSSAIAANWAPQLRRERRAGELLGPVRWCPSRVTGISPARIGTSQPAATTRSRSRR